MPPPFDAKHEDHAVWFEKCIETLHRQRGIPKDQRIQQLLSVYYTMKQHPSENVADFAHRFAEHQHALEKLIPGIHRPSAGDDTELIHAFALKLRQDISADILSRDFNFPTLASLVEAAKRYESRHPPPSQPVDVEKWTPVAQFAEPRNRSQKSEGVKLRDSSQDSNVKSGDVKRICWLFNRYPKANCELPNGQCANGYIHKCKKCNKLGCKPHFHKRSAQNSQQSSNLSHGRNRPNNPPRSFANTVSVECSDQSTAQHDQGDKALLVSIHETLQTLAKGLKVTEQPPAPTQSQQSQSQDQLFGMPAITSLPANLNILGLDLAKKNILWTKITSAGVSLPLPLDSCCSVSLVSQKHAEKVAKSRPELAFTKLEQPVKVSVASPSTSLHAVGTMQVPITWANGRSSTFVMLVVPGLAWPILFGQNHLEATDACVRFSKRRVYFAHKDMCFEVPSTNSNPLAEFPQLGSPPNSAASSAHVTCLLTARPSPTAGEQLTLGKGFTLIPVCLLLTASLVGSSLFSEPLWLEGSSLAPGISVLSGPISLSCVSSQLAPGTPVPPAVSSVRPTQAHPGPPVPTLGISLESMQVGDWSSDDKSINLPEPDLLYYSTVLIRSTKAKFVLPFNALLGYIRPMAPADEQSLNSAVSNTAMQLANEWYSFAVNNTLNVHNEAVLSSPTTNVAMGDFSSELPNEVKSRPKQTVNATQTGLDSSILSDLLEPADVEHPKALPPITDNCRKLTEEQYFKELVTALDLDTPSYAHVPSKILAEFKNILRKYTAAFYLPNTPLSTIKGFYHSIDTGEAAPVYRLPYRKSPSELVAIKNELERMLKLHIVRPSNSPWGAPVILVRKPPEKGKPQPPRFVVDYRGLNAVTKGDGYPIPSVSNILDAICGGKMFAKLDLASGYWQVPLNARDQYKTAFATHLGLFAFDRMPFGLKTAPQTFQRILNTVFSEYLYKWLIIYIDDCITWSNSFETALEHYEQLLKTAVKFGIQFKPTKCSFFSQDLQVLGHRITPQGRFPTQKGTEAVSDLPRPTKVNGVKRFLGMVGYFREYIPNMSERSVKLRTLLQKGASFLWSDEHEAEFQDLKSALLSPDIMLYHPNWESSFEVHTDASKKGCGAMLAQRQNGSLRPVRFASRSFNPTESRWPTAHQELFAVKWALETFRHYLIGRKFKVITDHANLKFLASIAPQNSKLARWCLSLAEFDFQIEHRPGKENVVPDTLSRAPLESSTAQANIADLPPPAVIDFLFTSLCLDIPLATPDSLLTVCNDAFYCLSLACNVTSPQHASSSKSCSRSSCSSPANRPILAVVAPTAQMPSSSEWTSDLDLLRPLNCNRVQFAEGQRKDPWLGPLINFLAQDCSLDALSQVDQRVKKWVLAIHKRASVIDGILYYSDEFMQDPTHMRIFVPSDSAMQRHLLQVYHDSPLGMHRGRDATYNSLSRDFYWRNMSKHVRNWIRRCPQCIRFKTLQQPHGPMQIRVYQYPFHTLGVDYVGELPTTPSGNKWILTVVCPFSNYLRAIAVPDKSAPTAARVLLDEVFLPFGFPSVIQSDRGGEFLNALMHRLVALLSVKQVFTSGYRPRLNGATERVHRFLNSAIAIYCEKKQHTWQDYLQPAVSAHNTSPISGTSDITPFFLVFGRDAPSPETISLNLPATALPADHYAAHLVSRVKDAHTHFRAIKADLRRRQRELYDTVSRDIAVPEGKTVYLRKDNAPNQAGLASRFLCSFDGPYIVTGHPHGRKDLLTLRHAKTGEPHPRQVNIEKIVVVPDPEPDDLRPLEEALIEPDFVEVEQAPRNANSDLANVAFEFGKYLESLPSKSAISSQACKHVYANYPSAREILARHGKLRGLVKSCPYLQLDGGLHGGTYTMSLNLQAFNKLR